MGTFDTVLFYCPGCFELVEVQSKAGSCDLQRYPQCFVPPEIATSLCGLEVSCGSCKRNWRIELSPLPVILLPAKLPKETEDDYADS